MMHGGGWWSFVRYDDEQDRPEISLALLRRVATFANPYRWRIVLTLLAILSSTGIGLIPPLLYRQLIDVALPRQDWRLLNLLAVAMVVIPLTNGLIGVGQRYLSSVVGEGIICDLRSALYAKIQRMPLRFFTHTKTGELMSRLNRDVVGAQQAVTSTLISVLTNSVSVVATLAIMLSLEWRLTVASVLILPLFLLPSRRIGMVLRRLTRQSMIENGAMNAHMNETLNVSGALLVKLFGRGPDEHDKFAQGARRVRDIGVSVALISRWFFLGLSLVSAIGTALVFWLGGHMVLQGTFTVGTIVAFGAYLGQLYGPLTSLTNSRVELVTSLVSFERVFEVLDLVEEVTERPNAIELGQPAGRIAFEDVSFSYMGEDGSASPSYLSPVQRWDWRSQDLRDAHPRTEHSRAGADRRGAVEAVGVDGVALSEPAPDRRWALRNLSFEIRPGELAALVGPSGAGKTTITYLLPRLYDPTTGRITIDGVDLRDVKLDSLARNIGMVTQETYLFHDTVAANLRYAKPDATPSELEEACKLANIHDFIEDLPDGYETVVGERGYRLSGGEKQRLAIARVILKDPRILVLDEATSSLDYHSEALVQTALERVMKGRTSIVIAHRLSTILSADRILVIDGGLLIEEGTHAELVKRKGLYAHLHEIRLRGARAERETESASYQQ